MRRAGDEGLVLPVSKADLRAAVNAADDWASASAAGYNAALPAPARGTTRLEIEIPDTATIGALWLGRTTTGYLSVKGWDEDNEPWMLARGRGTVLASGVRGTS
jgi:hypothetical protein